MRVVHRRFRASLRIRFLATFGLLAIVPLLAVVAVLGERTTRDLETQSVDLQREAAVGVAGRLEAIFTARADELALLDSVSGISALTPDGQHGVLRQLLAAQPMYQEFAILDRDGMETVRLSRGSVVLDSDLRARRDDPVYLLVTVDAITQFGPVVFDDQLRQPLTSIGYPIIDRRTGELESVLVATVTFKPVWELLGSLAGDRQDVYVVNADGHVIAHKDPTIVLRGTAFTVPEEDGRAPGLTGEDAIVATDTVTLGGEQLTVVAEEPLADALAVVRRTTEVTVGLTVFALLAVIGGMVLVSRRVVRPVEEVAASARRVASGDRTHRIVARGNDEVTELAVAFNQMTLQLDGLIETLEDRVAERTRDIEAGAELQRELVAELEVKNAELVFVQERLEELIRSKDEFLGAVSHELRTPLTSVVGFASMIQEHDAELNASERSEMVGLIVEQAHDMADIINDLLVAARIEGGSLIVEPSVLDLREAIESVTPNVPNSGLFLSVQSDDVTAFADPVRVRQILRNLLVNADRYGGDDIEAVVSRCGELAVVEVRDNGEGVPEEHWETIFDPYQRAGNHNGSPASVGLGLSVSRSLARRMGGDLTYTFESGASVFRLTLPAVPAGTPEQLGWPALQRTSVSGHAPALRHDMASRRPSSS